jgi:hypothetical protein
MMNRIATAMFCALCAIFIASTASAEDTNLRATLGANATGWTVAVKINGTAIPGITGGSAQAVQVFHKNHPYAKEFPENRRHLLCLTEGTNTIEITYAKVEGGDSFDLDVYVRAIGYSKALLEATPDPKENKGTLKGTFTLHGKEPKGFKTTKLK